MDFFFFFIKRIIGSVLLVGVVSSSVVSAAGDNTVSLGGLDSKEKRTGPGNVQQSLDNPTKSDTENLSQTFLDHTKDDV